MTTTRDPLRTMKLPEPHVLARNPLSRRRGDKTDSRAELLRRTALRPRDGVTPPELAVLRALLGDDIDRHWSGDGEVRVRRSELDAVQISEAAQTRREALFDALDAARPDRDGPLPGPQPARAVLTGTAASFIVPDKLVRDRLGSTVRMPGNFGVALAQLDPHGLSGEVG